MRTFDNNGVKENSRIIHDENSTRPLTNPILDCELGSSAGDLVLYSKDVNEKVEEIKSKYNIDHVSLYFRDLNNGPWIGINEKEVFSPASLLKVPILIALLHRAEREPSILEKKVKILSEDINQVIDPNIFSTNNPLVIGNEYTLLDVAKRMIQYSDNDAVLVLLRNLNASDIENVFQSVGVPYKDTHSEVSVRVKDYAGFFRILFNASYLDRDMSELALEILSLSEYKNGIIAGTPENIIVAHKFGERSINNDMDIQLHDCGVVYYPGRPYILCIMTKGDDFKQQEKLISDLSRYIYQEVDDN